MMNKRGKLFNICEIYKKKLFQSRRGLNCNSLKILVRGKARRRRKSLKLVVALSLLCVWEAGVRRRRKKKHGEGVSASIYQRRRRVGAIKKRKWRDINLPTTFIFPPPPFNSRGFINCLGKGGLGGRAFF